MRRTFFLLFLLTSLGVTVRAQCDFVGVSVSASDTALISLYHPGFFFFGATANVEGYAIGVLKQTVTPLEWSAVAPRLWWSQNQQPPSPPIPIR